MKLTEKCKEAFLEYYWANYIGRTRFLEQKSETEDFFDSLYPIIQQALIIEFFDSVGIYIEVAMDDVADNWDAYVDREWIRTSLNSRTEATNIAIEKANSIYNEN